MLQGRNHCPERQLSTSIVSDGCSCEYAESIYRIESSILEHLEIEEDKAPIIYLELYREQWMMIGGLSADAVHVLDERAKVVGRDASPVARSKKCDTITIGEALEGTTLSEVRDKPVEKGDAAAIQAADVRATGASK
ncbi:hypothetical protein POM88_026440 [Heracleum sosnowskyi]|uniref:SMP domain-containing protein n=1 Tax=Heracleum sosnowskyi TaxID=360622 RepID=A0AAD8MNJ5_9APIA|nr:hypothetical protein POM88_026440 [Heracleum sosnowskyi]